MERRKILFTHRTNSDKILIITDAPKEAIEHWCMRYNQAQKDCLCIEPFDTLMTQYYVKILHDSEIDDNEDIAIIGFDEIYELDNYFEDIAHTKKYVSYEKDIRGEYTEEQFFSLYESDVDKNEYQTFTDWK